MDVSQHGSRSTKTTHHALQYLRILLHGHDLLAVDAFSLRETVCGV